MKFIVFDVMETNHIFLSGLRHALPSLFEKQLSSYRQIFFLVDKRIASIYSKDIIVQLKQMGKFVSVLEIDAGEKAKTIASANQCWDQMAKSGIDPMSLLLTLGGGTLTDLGGFVASCYMRGVDVIHIPTTLLCMVDAAIGGKTAVNLANEKNMIGTIHHPKAVWIDPSFLETLSQKDFIQGLTEILKHGIIADSFLYTLFKEHPDQILSRNPVMMEKIIQESVRIKSMIVQESLITPNRRHVLNFGHTFGHAIEGATCYSLISHGEAISIGMCCEAYLSCLLGYIPKEIPLEIEEICSSLGLPTRLPNLNVDTLISLLKRDKKTVKGSFTFVLLHGMAKPFIQNDVPMEAITETIRCYHE